MDDASYAFELGRHAMAYMICMLPSWCRPSPRWRLPACWWLGTVFVLCACTVVLEPLLSSEILNCSVCRGYCCTLEELSVLTVMRICFPTSNAYALEIHEMKYSTAWLQSQSPISVFFCLRYMSQCIHVRL